MKEKKTFLTPMKIAAKKHKEGVSHKKTQKNTKKTQKEGKKEPVKAKKIIKKRGVSRIGWLIFLLVYGIYFL
jgi:hypothetical protein